MSTTTAALNLPLVASEPASFSLTGAAAGPRPEPFVGGAVGGPRVLLRLEGALVLAAALVLYAQLGGGWGRFAALFLLPDLAMLGYLIGRRTGAVTYNLAHSYLGPALLAAASVQVGAPGVLLVAVIWAGHVGFDRMLGYGLKYATAFGDTHLGRVGDRRAA